MTDKKTEALKLALDVLTPDPEEAFWFVEKKKEKAITAIRKALADSALDRMAENARELGLDYEPPCKTGSQCTNKCQQCEKPAQQHEPFTYYRHYDGGVQDWPDEKTIPLYTSPPAQPSKPWAGLTEEDIVDALPEDDTPMSLGEAFTKFSYLIEAKLREKNA